MMISAFVTEDRNRAAQAMADIEGMWRYARRSRRRGVAPIVLRIDLQKWL